MINEDSRDTSFRAGPITLYVPSTHVRGLW